MAFHSTTARRYFGVLLAVAMAPLFAACSGSGPAGSESADRSTGENSAEAPAAPDASAPATTTPIATAAEPAEPGAASAGSDAAEGGTVGGDGSQIMLAPLSAADIDGAKLSGELGCSFSMGDAPLLIAMGDVASKEPSRGVVKVGDYVEAVAARGGFDGMLRGAQFTGAGKTIRIALTGAATGSGESPPAPATLTYDRADGAKRSYTGEWQCGP